MWRAQTFKSFPRLGRTHEALEELLAAEETHELTCSALLLLMTDGLFMVDVQDFYFF